jgi:hypothetical protein
MEGIGFHDISQSPRLIDFILDTLADEINNGLGVDGIKV